MKVLVLAPYHIDFCSGQRGRIELWANDLRSRGFEFEFLTFTDAKLGDVIYEQGFYAQKAWRMLKNFARQLHKTLSASRPDVIFIYREASLIGPAIIENIVKRWGIPIIYDLDEPLFVPYVSPRNGRLNVFKFPQKTDSLVRMSDKVLVVNNALKTYASKFNDNVSVVPMGIDTERYVPAEKMSEKLPIRIVWLGSLTTQTNLEIVSKPLRRLCEKYDVVLRIIAGEPMEIEGVKCEFIKWSYEEEIRQLQESHIGIVPVKDNVWNPWKFFFKTIQFMSIGLPIVATPIGANNDIVKHGINGFIANNDDEWYNHLQRLIDDRELRRRIGDNARLTAEKDFSLANQIDVIERIFNEVHSAKKKPTIAAA